MHGKQGLAFRGFREDQYKDDNIYKNNNDSEEEGEGSAKCIENPGNFLMILKKVGHCCPKLNDHLTAPAMKNAGYLSVKSQNQIINVIELHILQKLIIGENKTAGFHSVMSDEVTSSNDEVLSICFRYIDSNKDIREVFLEFAEFERIARSHTGACILNFYGKIGDKVKK